MRRAMYASAAAATIALGILAVPAAQSRSTPPPVTPDETGCSPQQRREMLRAMQAEVLAAAPATIESFARALAPGGRLEGWSLSHGYVVLATAGAVAADHLQATPPLPPLLLYTPSPASGPSDCTSGAAGTGSRPWPSPTRTNATAERRCRTARSSMPGTAVNSCRSAGGGWTRVGAGESKGQIG